jgi:hypothetical protein
MSAVSYVVVFGLDGEGRPRAACFAEHDAALAIKAACYLGYRTVPIVDPGLAEVLPRGNVFAPRNVFARRISRAVFEKLLLVASQTTRRTADAGLCAVNTEKARGLDQ